MREKANGPELLLGALLYPLFVSRGRTAGVLIAGGRRAGSFPTPAHGPLVGGPGHWDPFPSGSARGPAGAERAAERAEDSSVVAWRAQSMPATRPVNR